MVVFGLIQWEIVIEVSLLGIFWKICVMQPHQVSYVKFESIFLEANHYQYLHIASIFTIYHGVQAFAR